MANQFSLNDYLVIDTAGRVGIGHTAPTARLYVTGAGATSATVTGHMLNSSGSTLFYVRDDGNVGIGTSSPSHRLDVTGSTRINGTTYVSGSVDVSGSMNIDGQLTAISKSFLIKHPNKPGWILQHGSLEGPENGVYIRGKISGNQVVKFPDYWHGLVDEKSITVQITPIGKNQNLYIKHIDIFGFSVGCDCLDEQNIVFMFLAQAARTDTTFVVEYMEK